MSYCLNPKCPNPADPWHAHNRICCHCGSSLVLQQRYHIKRLLGEGGFGKTFEVEDHHHLQTKVLKVLIDDNPKAVALFEREAQVLSRLQHPGIPKVEPDGYFTFYPRNSHKPLHCLVMELIEGCNLEEWMTQRQNQPITESRAIDWLKQLVEILHRVHHHNYFHRDIKPSNIMLRPSPTGEDWQLALIDFGTVREVSGTYLAKVGAGHRMTGIVSPGYTPPEQINGKAVPQSDFFALGRTFVYLLTGKHPNDFQEDPRTGELRWREYTRISESFASLIDRLISPFPGNRPHNTDVLLHYLETIDRPASFPTTPSPSHLATPSPSHPVTPSPRHPVTASRNHRSSRSRRWRAKKALTKKVLMGTAILILPLSAAQFSREIDAFLRQTIFSMGAETAVNMVKMSRSPDSLAVISSVQQIALTNTISAHLWGVNAVAISPNNQRLVSGSADKTLKIWDVATGDPIRVLDNNGEQVSAVAVSPKGFTFASGGSDRTVKLWGIESGKLLWSFEGHSGWILALAYSPDGNILASGSADGTVKLWDLASANLTHTLSGHTNQVVSLAFSPREPLLASGSDDGTIKLWNTNTGKLLQTWQSNSWRVRSVAISPDGKILASGSESGTIQLYSLQTGELLRTLHRHSGIVQSLAFLPESGTSSETLILAIGGGSLDSTIELWDASIGEHLRTLTGHRDTVHSLSISADGSIITSGSEDNTIKIWRVPQTGQITIEK